MISERALKGQSDKLYFCTSPAPPNVTPSDSLAPELTKLQAESYVGVRYTLSLELARGTALRWRNRFFNWYLKSCAALHRPQINTSIAADRTRCTLLRANHSHQSELAECFGLLPMVYGDGTFKATPLTLLNPQSEMTPEIWVKSSPNRHKYR